MFFSALISVNPSGPARACASARAFTLVELLAAVVGAVVVLSAATGFLLTAFLRQKAVLEAQRLEALHDDLAQTIGTAIKTADAFQIYSGRAQYGAGRLGTGSRTGNLLVCLKAAPDGRKARPTLSYPAARSFTLKPSPGWCKPHEGTRTRGFRLGPSKFSARTLGSSRQVGRW